MNKAVFLDKDGTLVEDVPYNVDPASVRFTANSITGLLKLQRQGYSLIIISNQSGIAKGFFDRDKFLALKKYMNESLEEEGVKITDWFFCPHHPKGIVRELSIECECRKPKPGMILSAAAQYNIDLASSWMIGDILNDIEAGNRAGCRSILLDNGNETEWNFNEWNIPAHRVSTISEAAEIILEKKLV